MKKIIILAVCASLALSGCGTYAGQGANTGAGLGSILGSAIGGISGGHRGSDIGTVVGMAGGAVIGAAVGSSADKARQRRVEQSQYPYENVGEGGDAESGFDPNNAGDDRIVFDEATTGVNGEMTDKTSGFGFSNGEVEIRNIAFVDSDGDGILKSSEECKVSFEIMNRSSQPLHNVTPMVKETTGNKRVYISPSILIERIMPHRGIRYTAAVVGASKLKNGEIIIQPGVVIGDKEVIMPGSEIKLTTRKR